MTRLNVLGVLLVLAIAAGCNKYNVKYGQGGNMASPPKKDEWQMHFLYGLIGEANVDVNAICGGPDATVHIERTFLDGIIMMCTNGLVMPSHIQVHCGGAAAAVDVPLTQEQAEKLVQSDEFRDAVAEHAPDRLAEVDALRAAY